MISDIIEPRNSPAVSEMEVLEHDLPAPLPADYRRWLEKTGGAYLLEDLVIPDSNGNAILQEILSPRQVWANYPGTGESSSIPLQFLMIGYGAGGAICIQLAKRDYGSIWFADFDLASSILEDGQRSMEIMSPVANNWVEFLASR